jgi:hypothetical protein
LLVAVAVELMLLRKQWLVLVESVVAAVAYNVILVALDALEQ